MDLLSPTRIHAPPTRREPVENELAKVKAERDAAEKVLLDLYDGLRWTPRERVQALLRSRGLLSE